MKALTAISPRVDLVRDDRQPVHIFSIMVKALGAIIASTFVAGETGDLWLAAMVAVGYPAAWSVAWIISKK